MRLPSIFSIAMAAGLVLAIPSSVVAQRATEAEPARIDLTDDGPVLVTPAGMTLYLYGGDDATPGKSACSDKPVTSMPDPTSGFGTYNLPGYRFLKSCAEVAPPFLAPAGATPHGDWSLFQRADGNKQWLYRSRPLYTSSRDHKPGDRNGISYDQRARQGYRLALAADQLPGGLDLVRIGEQLVLADANRRPIYTPRGARPLKLCAGCEELFQPLAAPALTKVSADWSVVKAGPGSPQYAFKGKPLFLAPASLTNRDIEATGDWDMVVYRKGAGLPPAIATRYSPVLGDIYTTREGRSLYIFTCTSLGCEAPGGPAAFWSAICGDGKECARRWRPYLAAPGSKPVGDWSIIDVADPVFSDAGGTTFTPDLPRVKAWAYRDRPVFMYRDDREPGDIAGHMIRWHSFSGFFALQVPERDVVY